MLVRLYNSGVKVKSLIENFGFSRPTLKRWGDVLKSRDAERLYHAFSGQGARKKIIPQVISFAIHDFEHIYLSNQQVFI